MKFAKMQGTGNDFLLVEASDDGREWGALARAMCDRHYGVGAAGLMLVMPSEKADVRMRLFNADGSEAEVSGNGVRCLVKYVIERGLAPPRDGRLRVEGASGVLGAGGSGEGGRGADADPRAEGAAGVGAWGRGDAGLRQRQQRGDGGGAAEGAGRGQG